MIRLPAEWEPQQQVLLTWPHKYSAWRGQLPEIDKFYVQATNIISQFQYITLIAYDKEHQQHIKKQIKDEYSHNIKITCIQTNDTWIRDYGPITVYNNQNPMLLNFNFNGWGSKFPANLDNLVNTQLIKKKQPHKDFSLILEGGSIDSNGDGELLTTESCLLTNTRNKNHTKEKLEIFFKENLGIKKTHWLQNTTMLGDDTDGHIDMFARFVNKKTIVYAKSHHPNDPNAIALNKLEQQLTLLRNSQGEQFNLIPLPQPQAIMWNQQPLPVSYINFLLINQAVLVPTYNVSQDKTILEQFQTIFPQKKIYGIDSSILIRHGGSIHCASMNLF